MLPIASTRFDLARHLYGRSDAAGPVPRAVVALPARDEEERIARCLSALAAQRRTERAGDGFGVLVLANNCRDETAARAREVLAAAGLPHRVVAFDLPSAQASAGGARGLALDLASLWIERGGPGGTLLTTDADTVVGPDWLARNLAGLRTGCGAVAGRFEFDPGEAAAVLPAHLHRRRRLETAYEAILLALAARLDPLPHDPWPNHWTASGASFALTLAAYRRIGGQPEVEAGEDRALAAALARHDIPIRHDPAIVVRTSARLDGRAVGGCASALRARCAARDLPGDEKLEALPVALRRIVLRARLRRCFARGLDVARWEHRLSLPPGTLAAGGRFGEGWARAEALSPLLAARPLRPSQMERHLAAARRLLRALEAASARGEEVEPIIAGALLGDNFEMRGRRGDEHLRRGIA